MGITEGELLQQRAESGDAEAQMTLALLLDKRGMHDLAVNWLREASRNGHAVAQHILGARLLVGRAAPFEPDEGLKLVSEAAEQRMPEAMALLAVLATMSGNWDEAVNLTKAAAVHGDERAGRQISMLSDPKSFDARKWDAPVKVDWKFKAPRIGVVRKFIPHAFCDWIVERAKPKLQEVRVKDPSTGKGREADYRSNSGAGFSLIDSDLILQMVNARIADLIGLPLVNQEPTNVLHYRPGEEYKAHFDFITASPQNAAELEATGQRVNTVLIYLNDDYAGGDTEFPSLRWKFKGEKGDALVFRNLTEQGEPDKQTLHAGLPPSRGEKWLFSKWVRANPYPLI